MQFGITLKPDISVERVVGLTRQAEAAGFQYGWIFDSHILWKDPYPLLTLMAVNTRRMRLGACVTNPAVRDVTVTASLYATLNLISGGRMELGIGRGGASRRILGKKPSTLAQLEETVRLFRELSAGRQIQYDGQPARLAWASESPRVWVAGSGPKALNLAGRIADGVILQFADPDLIRLCLGFVHEGARQAGHDPRSIEVMSAAPVWLSEDLAPARARMRWFPALESKPVMNLIARYKPEELPPGLSSYARNRGGFVSDEVVDRFCLLGPAEAHRQKLATLAGAGVTQFNIYLMCGDEEQILAAYQRDILPRFL